MSLSRFWKKLSLFYNLLIKPPKCWRLPHKRDVLIYDGSGLESLMPYLNGYLLYVHYNRGEAVNVPCLVMSLFDMSFWRGKPLVAYGRQVIKMVAPKVVLTFIDNNKDFYRIAVDHQGVSTIFIQNGWRGSELFENLSRVERYRVDYMLVFNRVIAAKYREYIEGEILITGSLKNNQCKDFVAEPEVSGTVLFISQYIEKRGSVFLTNTQGQPMSWENFYKPDLLLVQWLGAWCSGNGRKLLVCGYSMKEQRSGEVLWYESILSGCGCSWEYLPKNSVYDSYIAVQRAEIVVTIDSTLGYEAFGSGKKTAFLTGRRQWVDEAAWIFAWPAGLPDSGLFWSNNVDKSEFLRIMDYLNSVSDEEWMLIHERYRDDVMAYDPGNTILQQLLDKLLPKPKAAMEG